MYAQIYGHWNESNEINTYWKNIDVDFVYNKTYAVKYASECARINLHSSFSLVSFFFDSFRSVFVATKKNGYHWCWNKELRKSLWKFLLNKHKL